MFLVCSINQSPLSTSSASPIYNYPTPFTLKTPKAHHYNAPLIRNSATHNEPVTHHPKTTHLPDTHNYHPKPATPNVYQVYSSITVMCVCSGLCFITYLMRADTVQPILHRSAVTPHSFKKKGGVRNIIL